MDYELLSRGDGFAGSDEEGESGCYGAPTPSTSAGMSFAESLDGYLKGCCEPKIPIEAAWVPYAMDSVAYQNLFYGGYRGASRTLSGDSDMVSLDADNCKALPADSVLSSIYHRPTLDEIDAWGLLHGIPRKMGSSEISGTSISEVEDDETLVCRVLFERGYDIRLGETGRARLKKEISQRLKESPVLKEACLTKVCRLKNANVIQLIKMAELTGCLTLALRISTAYWKDYARKQGGQSLLRKRNSAAEYAPPQKAVRECDLLEFSSTPPASPLNNWKETEADQTLEIMDAMGTVQQGESRRHKKRVGTGYGESTKKRRKASASASAWRPKTTRLGNTALVSESNHSSRRRRRAATYKAEEEEEIIKMVMIESMKDAYSSTTKVEKSQMKEEHERDKSDMSEVRDGQSVDCDEKMDNSRLRQPQLAAEDKEVASVSGSERDIVSLGGLSSDDLIRLSNIRLDESWHSESLSRLSTSCEDDDRNPKHTRERWSLSTQSESSRSTSNGITVVKEGPLKFTVCCQPTTC